MCSVFKLLEPVLLNVLAQSKAQSKNFCLNFWNILVQPMGLDLWILPMVSVSALAESLAQMLRLVGSELNFYKQRLRYSFHNFFSTSKFQVVENEVHIYKTLD